MEEAKNYDDSEDKRFPTKFPKCLRHHNLWFILHGLVAILGVILTIIAIMN